jgi:hypothetical protein
MKQTLPAYEYNEPETETREFEPEVEPTEYECNTCGWRGCPSSSIVTCGGETTETLFCPRCRNHIHFFTFDLFFALAQRASAAWRADSERCSAVWLRTRALPPRRPIFAVSTIVMSTDYIPSGFAEQISS